MPVRASSFRRSTRTNAPLGQASGASAVTTMSRPFSARRETSIARASALSDATWAVFRPSSIPCQGPPSRRSASWSASGAALSREASRHRAEQPPRADGRRRVAPASALVTDLRNSRSRPGASVPPGVSIGTGSPTAADDQLGRAAQRGRAAARERDGLVPGAVARRSPRARARRRRRRRSRACARGRPRSRSAGRRGRSPAKRAIAPVAPSAATWPGPNTEVSRTTVAGAGCRRQAYSPRRLESA